MVIDRNNNIAVRYDREVFVYKKTKIKLFFEKNKNFKLL